MISRYFSNNTKKIVKPFLKSYLKIFTSKKLLLENKEFSYNLKGNSYFPFKIKIEKKNEIINYNKISKKIFTEIGKNTYEGIHPEIENMYPSACSYAPFFEKQSNLVFTNFLSTHYGLNNPQIILLRFEAQRKERL